MHENAGDSAPFQVLNLAGAIEFLGDEQAVSELLQPLVMSLSKDIGEVERLLGQADMPGVARTLHSLKGFIPVFCHAELLNPVGILSPFLYLLTFKLLCVQH
jgi:hypothetical protein